MADPHLPTLRPDFNALGNDLQTAATHLSRLQNIPAVDQGNALIERLNEILARFDISAAHEYAH